MNPNALRVVVLLCFCGLAGCGVQPGKTVYTQGANAEPVMGTAPETGVYQLYTARSPNPTAPVKLREGEPRGFRKTDGGQIEGVAGDQSVALPKGPRRLIGKLTKE